MCKKISPFLVATLSVIIFSISGNAFASDSGLVIDEFKIAGDAGSYDEYIILANYGTEDINLANYSLKKKTVSGRKYNLFTFSDFIIEPNAKIILAGSEYTGEKDFTYTNSIAADNTILIYDSTGNVVDFVGYGEVPEFEGKPLVNPETNDIYKRNEGIDTDNNFNDFFLVEPESIVDINADKILITEVMPNPEEGEEWFELYNPTNLKIGLYGLKICDGAGKTHCYSFGEEEFLLPYSYLVYEQNKTKITLNNDGDWLEIFSDDDSIITNTNEDYGESDKGNSFALFGSGWVWTSSPTKGYENLFTDIIEVETTKPKKTTVKKASVKKITSSAPISEEAELTETVTDNSKSEVKGEALNNSSTGADKKISQKMVGYGIIGLAVVILLGYTLWENKERISEFYKRFNRKND